MLDNLSQISGDDLILAIIEDLKYEKISVQKAFEKIREVLQINLELLSATKNIHNYVLIARLISVKIFPFHFLNPKIVNMINKKTEINFTKNKDFGERITKSGERILVTEEEKITPAITKGCYVLLFEINDATSDINTKITINKLNKYIESTGDVIKYEDILE